MECKTAFKQNPERYLKALKEHSRSIAKKEA
jgi:YHS domain-containing protein